MNALFESIACLCVAYDPSVPVFDVKDVDGQSVLSRDGSGSENVDAGHGKGPGDFLEDSLPVSGYDVYDRKGSSEIVSPTYDRNFGIAFVLLKAVNHVDVQGDFLFAGVGKIPDWNLLEMLVDFFLGNSFHFHVLVGVFQGTWVFSGVFAFQDGKGVGKQLRMQFLLVVVP